MAATNILSRTTDSQGNPGKWKYNAQGKLIFVAAKAPAAKAPAAAAPVADVPGATQYQPNEWYKDSTYNALAGPGGSIETGLNNLKGYLTGAGTQLGAGLGVQFDRNATDPLQASNFRIDDNVDVTNPFSRAALLKRSYQQAQAGNTNGYAARGQLYSGALQGVKNNTAFQNLGAQNSLISDAQSGFGGLYKQWLDAQGQANTDRLGAQAAAFDRNQNQPVSASDAAARVLADQGYPGPAAQVAAQVAAPQPRKIVQKKSAAHGGQLWDYYVGASGALIPLRKAS